MKAIIDAEVNLDYAMFKGREEGMEEGKIEMILSAAAQGLDISTIAQVAGFSEERIEDIIEKHSSK